MVNYYPYNLYLSKKFLRFYILKLIVVYGLSVKVYLCSRRRAAKLTNWISSSGGSLEITLTVPLISISIYFFFAFMITIWLNFQIISSLYANILLFFISFLITISCLCLFYNNLICLTIFYLNWEKINMLSRSIKNEQLTQSSKAVGSV